MSTVMNTDGMQHHQMFECLLNSFPASLCCSAGANINCGCRAAGQSRQQTVSLVRVIRARYNSHFLDTLLPGVHLKIIFVRKINFPLCIVCCELREACVL